MMGISRCQQTLAGNESDSFIKMSDDEHQQRISFVTMKARGDGIH